MSGASAEAIDNALTERVLGISMLYRDVIVTYACTTYGVSTVSSTVVVLVPLLHFDSEAGRSFTAISLTALIAASYVFDTFVELRWS